MPKIQQPLNSGFTAFATAEEVVEGIDLSGKTAIVTGGYSGLGLESAKRLSNAGACVIVPARDVSKARAHTADVPRVTVLPMDLLDRASVDRFALDFLLSGTPLDILINSAGIMNPPLFRDADGNEGQFAVNHLGHFRLVQKLLPALEKSSNARVVSTSSRAHFSSPVNFEDPAFRDRPYDPIIAYGQSKTANALFAVALDARYKDRGIRAFSLHPGAILTGLMRNAPREVLQRHNIMDASGAAIIDPLNDRKSVEQGAATQIWCAVSAQLDGLGGIYCEDCDIAPVAEEGATRGVQRWASDPELADRLWSLSEELVG
ncbi:short-chain dehydrogenase/reductase SDR [Sphingopyxis fribergensis]|uniref:Probable oxidoreductase n=1 Tax=Sphingopyxis fribergensis TaxID=1515612 RepID=A0A0A7PNN7_9SPHN|nr:SDR family NAD(P)-dependent oxidoreductase [Sphingopyxis fribergensis]AJA09537.1 short-chain dehydrogenase/reductase SDR [Sphingopyxis fribergensis]